MGGGIFFIIDMCVIMSPFSPEEAFVTVIYAFPTSRIDCYKSMLYGMPDYDISWHCNNHMNI